jgi:hypothetical protein
MNAKLLQSVVSGISGRRSARQGATNAKERVSLIADSRSDSTMAHEAGHFSELSLAKANRVSNTVIRGRARRCCARPSHRKENSLQCRPQFQLRVSQLIFIGHQISNEVPVPAAQTPQQG